MNKDVIVSIIGNHLITDEQDSVEIISRGKRKLSRALRRNRSKSKLFPRITKTQSAKPQRQATVSPSSSKRMNASPSASETRKHTRKSKRNSGNRLKASFAGSETAQKSNSSKPRRFQPLRSLVLSNPLWPTWGHSLTCRHSSAQWIARKLKPFKNGLKSSKSG